MSTENGSKLGVKSGILRFFAYALIATVAVNFLENSYALAYYIVTLAVVSFTAYLIVSESRTVSLFVIGLNVLFVQLSTYQYLSSTEFWFSFYGTELVLSVVTGLVALIAVNFIMMMIMGSIVYGDLGTYSDAMERRKMDRHEDPYGDDHAQRILNDGE